MTRQVETTSEKMYIDTELLSDVIQSYRTEIGKKDWGAVSIVDGLIAEIQELPMYCISTKVNVLK